MLGSGWYSIDARILDSSGALFVAKECAIGGAEIVVEGESKAVCIGKAALLSWDITIATGDLHSVFDANTLAKLNEPCSVVLGAHCWIGMDACILKGAHVKRGSIVAARSLVLDQFESRALIAGVPAKVVKENVSFCRSRYPSVETMKHALSFSAQQPKELVNSMEFSAAAQHSLGNDSLNLPRKKQVAPGASARTTRNGLIMISDSNNMNAGTPGINNIVAQFLQMGSVVDYAKCIELQEKAVEIIRSLPKKEALNGKSQLRDAIIKTDALEKPSDAAYYILSTYFFARFCDPREWRNMGNAMIPSASLKQCVSALASSLKGSQLTNPFLAAYQGVESFINGQHISVWSAKFSRAASLQNFSRVIREDTKGASTLPFISSVQDLLEPATKSLPGGLVTWMKTIIKLQMSRFIHISATMFTSRHFHLESSNPLQDKALAAPYIFIL